MSALKSVSCNHLANCRMGLSYLASCGMGLPHVGVASGDEELVRGGCKGNTSWIGCVGS